MIARPSTLALGLVLPLVFAVGCGSTGDSSSPSWAPALESPSPRVAPPKRVVEQRNPFGDTPAETNLVADGDFELTGRQDQMPWLAFGNDNSGQKTLDFETGGRCRSGIRCASLGPGEQLIGWLASPREGTIEVSIWAKPKNDHCGDIEARVLDLDTQSDAGIAIPATTGAGDVNGWCHLTGTAPNLANRSAVVYVALKSGVTTTLLVDDAFAKPGALVTKTRAHATDPAHPLVVAHVRFISSWLKAHRRFGLPPERLVDDPPTNPQRTR
jgi:hypothetical protein